MADTKKLVTPLGKARFFCIGREETYEGKGTGKQTAQIVLEGKALQEMTAHVDEFVSEFFTPKEIASGVNLPFKKTKDGEAFIKAKAYFTTKDGDPVRIPVSDSKGKLIAEPPQIGNGSSVRLRIVLKKTKFQGKLYVGVDLRGVQIAKLVEYSEGGFDAVEDEDGEGYVADEFSAKPKDTSGFSDEDLDDEIPF